MAKEKNAVVAPLLRELVQLGVYKRNQGRIARQVTFAALALIFTLGAWSLSEYYTDKGNVLHYYVPLALLAAGWWISFRVVQLPTFADFLISVEGEMNKVSWPSRGELFRASLVVMVVIFFLAALLFGYDFILTELIRLADEAVGAIFD